jgi:hypothetical protein
MDHAKVMEDLSQISVNFNNKIGYIRLLNNFTRNLKEDNVLPLLCDKPAFELAIRDVEAAIEDFIEVFSVFLNE